MAISNNRFDQWIADSQSALPWTFNGDGWRSSGWYRRYLNDDDDVFLLDEAMTDEDTPISIDVLGGVSGDDADELNVIYRFDTVSANGAEIRMENGELVYDPRDVLDSLAVGDTLEDSFFYVLGELDDDEIDDPVGTWITVTVTGVNDAPTTMDLAQSVNEDGPALLADFQGDDIDSDDDRGSLTYTILAPPAEGIITNNGNASFTFDPAGDFEDLALTESRDVTFTYEATDQHGAVSNISTGTITVIGANDQPIAEDVAASVDEDALGVTAAFVADDVDATDLLSYEIVLGPDKGHVINNGDGTFTYSPYDDLTDIDGLDDTPDNRFQYLNDGDSEEITFTYVAIDDSEEPNDTSEEQTVTITVMGSNDSPLAFNQQLEFLSNDQSIWGPGGAAQIQQLNFLGGDWDESESPTLIPSIELFPAIELCDPFFGTGCVTVTDAVVIPALGVNAGTSGTVGLLSELRVDSGSIDSQLFVDTSITVPFQVAEGQNISVGTSALLDALSTFSITTPFISYDLNLIFNVAANLGVWSGNSSNDTSLVDFSFGNALGFDSTNPTSGAGTSLLSFSTQDLEIEFPLSIGGIVTATLEVPDLDATGALAPPPPPNVVASDAEDAFFTVDFDLDAVATTLLGLPPLGADVSASVGPFSGSASYNLFDATISAALTVTQDFELTAEDFLFDIFNAETGDIVVEDISAGDSFDFTIPNAADDFLNLRADVDVEATLNNQTGIGFDVDFLVSALSASLGLSAFGVDLVTVSAGPVFSDELDIVSGDLGTFFDETFNLAGFQEDSFDFGIFVA